MTVMIIFFLTDLVNKVKHNLWVLVFWS